jgi:PilZ domain
MSRHTGELMFEAEISWVEMRIAVRHSILQRCFVIPAEGSYSEPWRCIAYNISATGIGVTVPMQVPVGTTLIVRPWRLPGAVPLRADVIHVRPVKGYWFAGCELSKRLTDDEMQIWRSAPVDWVETAPAVAARQIECPLR